MPMLVYFWGPRGRRWCLRKAEKSGLANFWEIFFESLTLIGVGLRIISSFLWSSQGKMMKMVETP